MAALARFHTDVTWSGSIQAGGMGPDTPAMTAVGWGRHQTIQDGRWIDRATMADNYGHADVMRGWIDRDRLTFETIGDPPVRLRLVWDRSNPAELLWSNELSVGGAPWALIEEYRCRPAPRTATRPSPG